MRVPSHISKGGALLRILGKVLLCCPLLLVGCASNREPAASAVSPSGNVAEQSGQYGDDASYWDDHGSEGKPRIVIDLSDQRAYFYRGDQMVGVSVVSTGREGYNTPSGEFSVIEKDPTHVSSIYGDYVDHSGQVVEENVDAAKDPRPRGTVFRGAPMPFFLRIHGGIGMHAGYLPGYPASHGCIRMPKVMALRFYQNAAIGTPVVIRQEPPQEYGSNPVGNEGSQSFTSLIER
ncbi:MAG TPA: L,D-transpeptidase family protein [Chthoniobacterales bacterium]|nr:L,D-transpeptidase family protein [Chthoniobacterales bacterium]